jgi:hypothetical protein
MERIFYGVSTCFLGFSKVLSPQGNDKQDEPLSFFISFDQQIIIKWLNKNLFIVRNIVLAT